MQTETRPAAKESCGAWQYAAAALILPVVVVALLLARPRLEPLWADLDQFNSWLTIALAICLQSLPFLVLGVLISAAIVVYVPRRWITKLFPPSSRFSVPLAGLAGAVLPGCECASVPVARSLIAGGVPPAAALTFLLSAPAINPIVVFATAVAYNYDWRMVAARFVASLLAAMAMGWWWSRSGWADALLKRPTHSHTEGTRLSRFIDAAVRDLLHVGGYLAIGAAIAATLNVYVPRDLVNSVAGQIVLGIVVMGVLAVLVAICSEADAFVAISFTAFSPAAQLAFLVVGPMVDVKLIAMQAGTFGRRFVVRFAPMTFAVAVASAALVGWVFFR